jgi:hypothetical protein
MQQLQEIEPELEAHMSFPHTYIANHPNLKAAARQVVTQTLRNVCQELPEEIIDRTEATVLMMVCRAYDVSRRKVKKTWKLYQEAINKFSAVRLKRLLRDPDWRLLFEALQSSKEFSLFCQQDEWLIRHEISDPFAVMFYKQI